MAITFNSGYDYSPHKKANPVERGTIKSGTAMSFDGTSDYITVTNPTSGLDMGTTQDFSISLWLKASTQGDTYPSVIGSGTSSWSAGATAVRIGPNGNLKFLEFYAYNDSSGGTPLLTSTSEVVDDVWHFGVITRDGSSWTLYLDGESQDTGTSSASINLAHNGTLYIGKNGWDASSELDGQLSKLQIWNTALTLAQVQELYKQPELLLPTGTPNDSANSWSDLVVGQYLLNEGAGYTAFDSHIPLGEKKYGETSIVFDGTGDYLSIPDSNDWELGDTYTLEFWCRCADVGASQIGPCHQDDASSNRGLLTLIDGGKWKAGKSGSLLASTSDVDDDAWHHLVMSVDSGTGHLYVDGTREATGSVNDIPAVSGNFEIGRWRDSSGEYLDGYIDDLRITKGLAIYTGSTFDVPTSALTTTWSASTGIAANTDASKVVLLIHGDNSKNSPATGILDSSPSLHTITAVGDAKLTDYRLHGTVTGATWDTGNNEIYQTGLVKGRGTMNFDGTNDYVNLMAESVITGTGNFTVSCWASWGGSSTRQIWNQRASGDPNPSTGLLVNQATGNIRFETYTSDYQQYINSTSTDLNSNALNHIVCVRDGTTSIKLYVNGVLEGSHSAGSAVTLTAVPFDIGRNTSGSNYFPGFVDEFAMWDEALSQSEITTLYNNAIPYAATNIQSSNLKGYWRNDGISTWTDRSTNSNHGTVSGSPSLLFLPEGSTADKDILSFPLADTTADVLSLYDPAYFEFPPNSDLGFGSKDFTVEFWINIQKLDTGVLIGNAWGSAITDRAGWSLYWFDDDLYLSWSNTVGGSWVGDHAKAWTPDINTWIHFHLVRSGDTFTFYENNSVITSSFTRADPMPTELTKPFRLSSDPDDAAANFFNARYDEVRVYHKALSSAERIQNYNHGAVAHGKTVIEE